MELYEEEKSTDKKNQKLYLKIGLMIALFLLFIFIAMAFFLPKEPKEIKETKKFVTINGINENMPENFYIINDGVEYISIQDMANLLGYNCLRGEYIDRYTEDISKCYVEGEEISSFISGSNVIYKCTVDSTGQYMYYDIEDNVISYNNKLYCNMQGIQIGFNVLMEKKDYGYTVKKLQYLLDEYKNMISTKYTNLEIDDKTYENKKAILSGFVIMRANNRYGVLNSKGEIVIGAKYDEIKFSEKTKEFSVKSNNKCGILSTSGETKISLNYDEITLLNSDHRLYYVKRNDKYGVLDRNGRIVVHIEYDTIGIDSSLYPKNKIKNQKLLYDNCIPIKKGQKWGFYNKQGKLIVPIE